VVRKGFYPFSFDAPLPKSDFEASEFGYNKLLLEYKRIWVKK